MPRFGSIVVLTGAGISAESGLPTFRGADGLWQGHRVEEVASPQGFSADPELVQRFYDERRRALQAAAVHPNPAHEALAVLEQGFDGNCLLVTQNIDDLHERAGSRRVMHMHGELLKARCTASGRLSAASGDLAGARCRCCTRPQPLRPHVVWFGEQPLQLPLIYSALRRCDLFVAVGTSGQVYPAAGFAELAAVAGAHTVELNLAPSAVASHFAEKRYGPASRLVGDLVTRLLDR